MGDTYVWTGADTSTVAGVGGVSGAAKNLDDPANWFDETTGNTATHAPGTADIAIFTADVGSLYSGGTPDGSGGFVIDANEFDPGTLSLDAGVHVSFADDVSSITYKMGTLRLSPDSSFAVDFPAAVQIGTADIVPSATLDLSDAYWIGAPLHGPPGADESGAVNAAASLGFTGPLNGVVDFLTIEAGGSLILGDAGLGVVGYENVNEGRGNDFDPARGIGGTGTLVLQRTDVAAAKLSAATLDFGTVALGSTATLSLTVENVEGNGAPYLLVGALQTTGNGAAITDTDLSGSAATPEDFAVPGRGGTITYTLTLDATHLGAITGQAIDLAYEFNEGTFDTRTLVPITGTVVASAADPSCYLAGTRIATAQGETVVERLRPGDLVRCASGRLAPVQWLGWQRVPLDEAPEVLLPVRILADAFAPGAPRRDLLLSPDHAVAVGDCLVPVHTLLNGATIRREFGLAAATYVHVELDRHDLVLAEGLAAESYLDTGNRDGFEAQFGAEHQAAPAVAEDRLDASLAAYEERGFAPLMRDGPAVLAAHLGLARRARLLGWRPTTVSYLVAETEPDGMKYRPRNGVLEMPVPSMATEVHLHARSFVPCELDPQRRDGRRLGAALAVTLDGAPLPPDTFVSGWYAPEADGSWRWMAGHAVLRIAGGAATPGALLRCRIMAAGARYWLPPRAARLIGASQPTGRRAA